MSEISLQHIKGLSVEERLNLVEAIWETFASAPDSLPVTEAQKAEIDRRLAAHERDPETDDSWEEIQGFVRKGK